MSDYVIYTDSACDLPGEILAQWGVKYISLSFLFQDEGKSYRNDEMTAEEFYGRMRSGGVAKTSAVNSQQFYEAFEQEVKQGKDILYIGFSSGLSGTYQSACIAAQELRETYPQRKILTVDSLCASAGMGLMLYLAVQKKAEGADMEEVAQYVAEQCLHICHWFTVDDLTYLKRGGRITAAVALVGGMLGIRPVMHMDNEGHLTNVTKVRGRKASIQALAERYADLAVEATAGTIYISHGDCMDDARYLTELIHQRHGVEVSIITDVGPVIGAHSGPGTLALFFVGRER